MRSLYDSWATCFRLLTPWLGVCQSCNWPDIINISLTMCFLFPGGKFSLWRHRGIVADLHEHCSTRFVYVCFITSAFAHSYLPDVGDLKLTFFATCRLLPPLFFWGEYLVGNVPWNIRIPLRSSVVVSALASINEVNQRRARLVLRRVTVSGFNSRCRTFIFSM